MQDVCYEANSIFIFIFMYISVHYLVLLCVFVHFCVCENTSKIEYPSSPAQVVCDKAILSARESAVIASVPHL